MPAVVVDRAGAPLSYAVAVAVCGPVDRPATLPVYGAEVSTVRRTPSTWNSTRLIAPAWVRVVGGRGERYGGPGREDLARSRRGQGDHGCVLRMSIEPECGLNEATREYTWHPAAA
ncbi:hypothetical protein ACQP00_20065 [Dactylosporangium sp. CS-047395]|uniref:hypothetical protein n=1 Tax=Dactylosporangium sp. CS-047395 TaxID=3239936 RepID=UPI003D8C20A7